MFTLKIPKLFLNSSSAKLQFRLNKLRQISMSSTRRDAGNSGAPNNPGTANHRVDNLEKKFLVWTGKYKSVGEVPDFVSSEVMERARNRIRIRLANIMMLATVIGCIAMVISGKRASERGESVVKENLDWHKKYNEQKARENQS